jgi:hypothetical protein
MQQLGTRLSASLQIVGDAVRAAAGSPGAAARDARALRRAQRVLRATAAELARIVPPRALAADQRLLLKGVREYAAELDTVIARFGSGRRTTRAIESIPSLQGISDMTRATQRIRQRGYDITG